MKSYLNESWKAVAILMLAFVFVGAASAQITINLPKLPKLPKTKTTQTNTNSVVTETANPTDNSELKTVANNSSCKGDIVMDVYLKDIAATRQEAEEFRPGLRDYYVSDFSDRENKYLKASLSPSRRNEWMKSWPTNFVQCITPALEDLAAVAKRTLPGYTPSGYTLGTPAEIRVLKSGVNDLAQATVFKAGISSPTWNISKNSLGIPNNRYKYGIIWAKYPTTDDGFCRIIYVNLVQDYAGGGTYGESYGNFIKSEYAGCPVGK
jgi:hypothetical protein